MDDVVVINNEISVPRSELTYRATRSGGPGGQHVNTSSTRVELLWDVGASPVVSDEQRARIMERLKNRIGEDGVLRLTSAGSRSQHQNKEEVTVRFARIVDQALHVPKARKKTKPSRASKEARLQQKKRRSSTKQQRNKVDFDD